MLIYKTQPGHEVAYLYGRAGLLFLVLNKIKITQTNDIYMYVQVLLLQTVIYVIKIQHGIQERFRLMPIMQNIDVILI